MKNLLFLLLSIFNISTCANTYQLFEPVSTNKIIPCWANSFSEYTEVIGYSYLGHVFMRSPISNSYMVLHPYRKGGKAYGEFTSIEEFENKILKDPGFEIFVLNPGHVEKIQTLLGALSKDKEEVYIPAPYPFLGGDESVDSYTKGNLWVMLDIVGQFHGVC